MKKLLAILLLAAQLQAGIIINPGGGGGITANNCAGGQFATGISATGALTCAAAAGGGTVVGPGSSTDNGFTRWDGATGALVQDTGTGASLSDLGVGTFANIIDSGLTASQAVVSNGSKQLASLAYDSANTASALVQRDGSGNFAAGTVTAALTGNSSTATALAANPTDCGSREFATAIAASGNLTCSAAAATPELVTHSYFAGTTNCEWDRSNTAYGAFTTDADCPGPTVEYQGPGGYTVQTTDADLPQITVNDLPAGTYTVEFIGTGVWTAGADVGSLTISDGTTTSGFGLYTNLNGAGLYLAVKGSFTYASTGNRSFQPYAKSATPKNQRLNGSGGNTEVFITRYSQ